MRRLLAVLALVSAVACGGSDTPSAPIQSTAVGRWTLSTVNGAALPFTTSGSGANKTELISLTASVETGGKWSAAITSRTTTNGQQSTQSGTNAGTWSLTGTSLEFRSTNDGSVTTGSVNGNTLTTKQDGMTFVYTK